MKKMNYLVAIVAIAMLCVSCSTSQKFTVKGTPGTVITTLEGDYLSTIDGTGSTMIKMKRKEGYSPFLQAKAPNSDLYVPFALDYKNHSRRFQRELVLGSVGTMAAISIGCGIVLIAELASGEEGSTALGLAELLSLIGAGVILFPTMDMTDNPMKYDYNYLKLQQTNNDLIK